MRIVSLVPSITELLYTLGANVVGITKFCVHPREWHNQKQRIGGTKNVNIQKVLSLRPDLVIANKEENVKEQAEAIAELVPVMVTDVTNLEEAYAMIADVGEAIGRHDISNRLVIQIKEVFKNLSPPSREYKCAYLIWNRPYMTVGGDTFISDMLKHYGFKNAFAAAKRYPTVTEEDIVKAGCEIVFLSSEPYPFSELHRNELQGKLKTIKVILVDGEMFSWYGSRLLHVGEYSNELVSKLET